jgi:hypothetical protein
MRVDKFSIDKVTSQQAYWDGSRYYPAPNETLVTTFLTDEGDLYQNVNGFTTKLNVPPVQ